MSEQLKTALIRAGIGGVVLAGSAFFSTLSLSGSFKASEIAAGTAFFAYLILRGGIEGFIDAQAAKPV